MWMGCAEEPPASSVGPTETSSDTGTIPPEDLCGEIDAFDMAFEGRVEDASGQPVGGATVTLEERNWVNQRFGEDRSSAEGVFEISAYALPRIEGCWGTGVSYWLIGESGPLWGEKPLNANFILALEDGLSSISLDFPLILRE